MNLAKRVSAVLCLSALSATGQLWSSPVSSGGGVGLSHGRPSSADCPLPCGPSGCCNFSPDQCAWDSSRGYHCTASTMFAPGGGSARSAPGFSGLDSGLGGRPVTPPGGLPPSTPSSGLGTGGSFGGLGRSNGGGMGAIGDSMIPRPPTGRGGSLPSVPSAGSTPSGTGLGLGLPRGYDGSRQQMGTCSIATPAVVTVHPDGRMTAVGRRLLRGGGAGPETPSRGLAATGGAENICCSNCGNVTPQGRETKREAIARCERFCAPPGSFVCIAEGGSSPDFPSPGGGSVLGIGWGRRVLSSSSDSAAAESDPESETPVSSESPHQTERETGEEIAARRKLAVSIQEGVTRAQCELNCVGNENTCTWSPSN
uniref:Apple domain-containing protein n=1 Tax=Chromera velia CCMP2878 TaxID=1169474 RepID=A0A0G4FEY8_9ALVE|eukprot:Cvel_16595.t1-p1 / transcript=Cvel_16595.t1 / gene=Cvel_16595 / organism=Chromera_velia_CCMP2878 / gene_product=hypothetical protein / transcript_product=hypothetical protein / location=Cvel_scaffold1285:28881-30973(+) / protein_length=368 / sequence_SO=supercontig / SO=protein_coding / is_pseudo=false